MSATAKSGVELRHEKPMTPSNNPDVALSQEWLLQLDEWIESNGLKGHDPFDVKQHPWIRKVQPYTLPRRISTALCDLFPNAMRAVLGVPEEEFPKAFALTALGKLRLYELTHEEHYLEEAGANLQWLLDHPAQGSGLCWGYPFRVFGKGVDTPANTPVGVVSAIAGEAFLEMHRLTAEPHHLDAARSICGFMLNDLPHMAQDDGTLCFGYTPSDRRRVHNANLLAAEHLMRTAAVTGEDALRETAEPALAFTLKHQREDGAWRYGEYAEGEPFDPGLLALVDHHHTGFVLRSLHNIQQVRAGGEVLDALKRGWRYYHTNLYGKHCMPITEYGKYPVDIHAVAEAVLCPAVLMQTLPSATKYAVLAVQWAHYNMRRRSDNAPLYRKYPWFTSNIVFPRWSVAWMYRAIAEFLYNFYEEDKPIQHYRK